MVLSSGFVYSFHEAEVMRALALDQGIPAENIVLEEHATNTYENVLGSDLNARINWGFFLRYL